MNLNNLFPVLRTHESEPDVFRDLRQEVSRVFDDFNRIFPATENLDLSNAERYFIQPKIDVKETDKSIDIVVDVPGVKESDLDVQLDGKTLTIKGERSNEKRSNEKRSEQKASDKSQQDSDNYKVVERSYGSFMRTITLPFEADSTSVEGKLDSGVLTLTIEKPEEVVNKVKTVKITTTESADAAEKKSKPASKPKSKTSSSQSEAAPTA